MAAPTQVEIAISTTSEPMQSGSLPAPQPPVITLNGTALTAPPYPPNTPNGLQCVVFNSSMDLTNPDTIISNRYLLVWEENGGWWTSYPWMWNWLANQLLASGDPQQQIVIVATFGLDVGMVPTPAALEQMMARGAGPNLQSWATTSQPSEGGSYIEYPANYVMVGNSAYAYGQATDVFDYPNSGSPVTTKLTVTLDNPGPPPTT